MKRIASTLFLAAAFLAGPALAQSYPAKSVTLVVPYAPGGGHDAMARVVAERMGARIGHPMLVENRAGANGMIGAEFVARAPADGYTALFASPAEIVIAPSAYKAMRYDPEKDLTPVTLAGVTPLVIVAHPSLGIRTVPELIALAKARPGKLSYGTSGNASSQHLAGILLNNMAGIDLLHVPYKGAGPATTDVLAGHIPLAIVGMAPVAMHLKSGKLVPIAVASATRAEWSKDVPAVAETPGLAGFEATHWMGVFLPARTDPAIVDRLQGELAAVLGVAETRTRLLGMGIEPVANAPAAFRAFLAADRERFARMFKLSGLAPE